MAIEILNGVHTAGLEIENFDELVIEMMTTLGAGNTVESQNVNTLNAILQPMEEVVERLDGHKLPIEYHDVKFTEGGIQTSAKEFREYYDSFTLGVSEGMNVQAYDFSTATVMAFKNKGINPLTKEVKKLDKVVSSYRNTYLPLKRLGAFLTGSSLTTAIPSKDGGTGTYARAFGWARGEDFTGFVDSNIAGDTVRNHYRVIKGNVGDALSTEDLKDLIDSISDTKMFGAGVGGDQGIIALAHPRTVEDLFALANAPENKDRAIFEAVDSVFMFGVDFVKVQGFHKDFILFLDKSYANQMLLHAVNPDETQRGIAIVPKEPKETFKTAYDLDGAKVHIFAEEFYVPYRLSGGILSINPAHATADGTMDTVGATALNAWADVLKGRYTHID